MPVPTDPTASTRFGGLATLRDWFHYLLIEVGTVTIIWPLEAWRDVAGDDQGVDQLGGDRRDKAIETDGPVGADNAR